MELEQDVSTTKTEVAQLLSLYEKEKAKLANLTDGVKVADLAISDVVNLAMQKAKHIASTKAEAGRRSTLMAKARRDKETIEQKLKAL